MYKIEVNIINPKADRLLRDMADMNLISIKDIGVKSLSKPQKKHKGEPTTVADKEFLNYLKSWPIMSAKELKHIEEKRKHLNEWK